jgi:hypothetical protein
VVNYSKRSRPYPKRSLAGGRKKKVPQRSSTRRDTAKVDHRDIVVKPYHRSDDYASNAAKMKEIQSKMKPIRASQKTDLNRR